MKNILRIILSALFFSTVGISIYSMDAFTEPRQSQDVHTNANGWNWLEYSTKSRRDCVALIFNSLGTDREKYKEAEMVAMLNKFYSSHSKDPDAKKYLKIPCAVIIGEATGCKIEFLDENEQVKKVLVEPKN